MQQDNYINNNNISVVGTIATEKIFSHEVFGEGFYNFTIKVERLSDTSDFLPVTISERIIDDEKFAVGESVYIEGQIRSYNNYVETESRNRLVLTIFVKDCEFISQRSEPPTDEDDIYSGGHFKISKNPNDVFLNGYICKPPVYRTTPFGREIADILIAVNRSYNKSDYIPCIAWGRNARFSSRLVVGDNIKIWGRMQSREYQKKLDDGSSIEKTAYEVSVSKMETTVNSTVNAEGENESISSDPIE